ncbi:SDR family oxidoreductase [Actinomadura rugatobispora]|uniref:SDR family oxidoreductase n=1 Tax=Actinomadura rugatobispora TaxID=1994 RepID=A0ABW0ZS19_9ACTN|nr:butenolide phosphate reductase ScbC [Actinomadura rugatobispora]
MSRVLVTGASGQVGGALVRGLAAAGVSCRALMRDPASTTLPAQAEAFRGDFTDPSSLAGALRGVESAFLMAPARQLPSYARTFCDLLVDSGVKHVVLLSSLAVEIAGSSPLTTEHAEAEQALIGTGVGYTFLRAGVFSANTLMWAPAVRGDGRVRHPFGNSAVAPIDGDDIAEVALECLTSDEHLGATYPLTGPERMLPSEQVAILADILERPLRFAIMPEGEAVQMMEHAYSATDATAIVEALRSDQVAWSDPVDTVERITGRPPTTYREWAERHVDYFR